MAAAESAVLRVADNGIGIPQAHQARIFERFYRVDKSHSKETGGTGLGLSIVKHAGLANGGTIRLESGENAGTTVTVLLPKSQKGRCASRMVGMLLWASISGALNGVHRSAAPVLCVFLSTGMSGAVWVKNF